MRLVKIQPEKRLALFLLISVSLVWGQTSTSGRAADSSAPPTSFPAPTPAALATAEHAISGHDPGPSGPGPFTDLLKLLLANVNSTEAMTSMKAIWATERYFDFASFWTQPIAWDAHSARLEIVSPQVPEDMRVLADYQKTPTSLCQWSGPTPSGGVETEIVLRPKDIRNADLKGKLVLGRHMSKTDLKQAGALGMVRESRVNRTLLDERDWENDFGDNGWVWLAKTQS